MKTVASMKDLARLALEKGASVTLPNGRVINSEMAKEKIKPPIKAAEPPQKAPAAPPPLDTSLQDANARLAQVLQQALVMLQQPQSHPTKWEFTVERDNSGLMTKIVANPVRAAIH